jgi:hypothetical protein
MRRERDMLDKRTLQARELKRLIPIAEGYETSLDDARESSGVFDANSALGEAEWQVETVIATMTDTPATSLAGLAVKAKAINSFADLRPEIAFLARNRIGPVLAQDVAALATSGWEA